MSELLGFSFFPEITYHRFKLLAKLFNNDLSAAWEGLSVPIMQRLGLTNRSIERISLLKPKIDLLAYQEKLQAENIRVLDIFSADYPVMLKEIYDPPLLLYLKGPGSLSAPSLAVVGTRQPTPYGARSVQEFVASLKLTGCTIVSGMASGIDTLAHRTALDSGLPTIAVLGTGLDRAYPSDNKRLFEEIGQSGLLVSEYAFGSRPEKWHFPRRNRIITGLSRATLVIEGDLASGALISAKIALAQDRDVYALPGSIYSSKSRGPNWLISQGAHPLLGLETLQELFSGEQLHFRTRGAAPSAPSVFLSAEEDALYELIPMEEKIYFDDLIEKANQGIASLTKVLLNLELKGLIVQLPGKRIVRA